MDSQPKPNKNKSHLKAFVLNFVQDAAKDFHSGDAISLALPADTEIQTTEINPEVNAMVNSPVKAMVNSPVKAMVTANLAPTQNLLPRLTWRQDKILRILHDKHNEASRAGIVPYCNRQDLAAISGWAIGSIHAALRALKQKQYFKCEAKPVRISNYTAFIFKINQDLCQKYFTLYPQTYDNPDIKVLVNTSVKAKAIAMVNPLVKVQVNTSIKAQPKEINFIKISALPEFLYWNEAPNKITEKTFCRYMKEFNLTEPVLLRCLDHCRFYLEELGGPEGGIKKTALDFFYGTMKKVGFYAEPKGYKTLSQIRLEQEEKILREMKETTEKRERVRLEIEFEKIIQDPSCELYRQCFERINSFAKEMNQNGPNSPVFRNIMFEEFKKIEYRIYQEELFKDEK